MERSTLEGRAGTARNVEYDRRRRPELRDLERPLMDRAQGARERIERELRKSPDFQLFLITRSERDRARMKRVLMQHPSFRLWHELTQGLRRTARGDSAAGVQVIAAR